LAAWVLAAIAGCASNSPKPEGVAWPSTLYVNPQVSLPEQFRFIGNTGNGSRTMVVGHGFSSALVQADTPPEQPRMQLLYDHNRLAISAALLSRVQQEVAASKRYELVDSLDAAQGELRIQVLDVGVAPAATSETVAPYFRVEVSLYDKTGNRLWRDDVRMSSAERLQTDKAALLGDINGLKNFYEDGMPSVAQRLVADLSDKP
jgi:hypothetical protein